MKEQRKTTLSRTACVTARLKKTIARRTLLLLCGLSAVAGSAAQGDVMQASDGYVAPREAAVRDSLSHWQDLKFGVLMHWGLYSQAGIVESWSICDEDWITRDTTRTYQQYKEWYWGLADSFCPTAFDPTQWADVMQRAGMKYMIFTTKHHDGFCLFDSHYSDFTIARHAFRDDARRDVLRHVLDAFRQKGFMTGTYFSKPDWHSQDYWWDVYPTKRGRNVNYDVSKYPWRWQRFKDYTYHQIEELMTRYGNIGILWLDGGWVCPGNNQDIDMPRIARMARGHQPGLIIVDRTVRGPYENYVTPERSVPERQLPYPWESCIPLSDDWGYVARPRWKSARRVVNTLAEVVAKGGNLVLGVGPTPEGLIQPEAVERLDSIGRWLRLNGKAIYGTTRTTDYHDGLLWFTQSKDARKRYAIYALPEGAHVPRSVSWTGNVPGRGVRLLSTGKRLPCSVSGDRVTVRLPRGLNDSFALEISM